MENPKYFKLKEVENSSCDGCYFVNDTSNCLLRSYMGLSSCLDKGGRNFIYVKTINGRLNSLLERYKFWG